MSGKNYKWTVLAILGGAYFFHQADRAIFGVLTPYIQTDLALTSAQIGHISTVLFITIAVATFFAGFLGDRFSRKWIITGSLAFWSLATMCLGFVGAFRIGAVFVSAYAAVVLLRSVATGGGESFYGPAAMSLLASYHRETRSLAFSIHQAALYFGLMMSGFLASWAFGLFNSWRVVFVLFGGAGLLLALAFVFILKEPQDSSTKHKAQSTSQTLPALKSYFLNPSALLATAGFVAIVCANNAYLTWAPKLFAERFGVAADVAGAHAMFYHHLVAFVAILAGGWLTDRMVKRLPRFRLGFQIVALLLGAPIFLLIGNCGTFAATVALTAAYGLFRGLFEVNTHASVFDVVPPEHRASTVGFMLLLAMFTGAIFSGEIVGAIVERGGADAYPTVFALMAAAYAIAAALMAISFFFTFRRNRLREAQP